MADEKPTDANNSGLPGGYCYKPNQNSVPTTNSIPNTVMVGDSGENVVFLRESVDYNKAKQINK